MERPVQIHKSAAKPVSSVENLRSGAMGSPAIHPASENEGRLNYGK